MPKVPEHDKLRQHLEKELDKYGVTTGDAGHVKLKDWLKTSNPKSIETWLEQIARENWEFFPPLFRRMLPEEVMLAVKHNVDYATKQKIDTCLEHLLARTKWEDDSSDEVAFHFTLLSIVGYLNAKNCRGLVLDLARGERLKKIFLAGGQGASLHYGALAALASFMEYDEAALQIYERDINDPEFAGLCFRALWKYDVQTYLPRYEEHIKELGRSNPYFPADPLLKEARGWATEQANLPQR